MFKKKPATHRTQETSEQPASDNSQVSRVSNPKLAAWKARIAQWLPQKGLSDSSQEAFRHPHFSLTFFKRLLSQWRWQKKPTIDPVQIQREKLAEIGSLLYQVRTQQQVSLEEIAVNTRISPRLLKAIEQGNLEELPEPIYIRGQIRQFADLLGLDGLALAESFPLKVTSKSRAGTRLRLGLPTVPLRPWHLYFLYVAIVVLSVRAISNTLRNSALEMGYEVQPTPSISPSVVISPSSKPANPITLKPTLQKPVVVDVQLKDECWLKVVVDGKTAFEGILPQGTQRTWMANERLTVRAGNAGGVLVTFNRQQAKQLGEPGQVQEVTYQAQQQN